MNKQPPVVTALLSDSDEMPGLATDSDSPSSEASESEHRQYTPPQGKHDVPK